MDETERQALAHLGAHLADAWAEQEASPVCVPLSPQFIRWVALPAWNLLRGMGWSIPQPQTAGSLALLAQAQLRLPARPDHDPRWS